MISTELKEIRAIDCLRPETPALEKEKNTTSTRMVQGYPRCNTVHVAKSVLDQVVKVMGRNSSQGEAEIVSNSTLVKIDSLPADICDLFGIVAKIKMKCLVDDPLHTILGDLLDISLWIQILGGVDNGVALENMSNGAF